MIVQNTPDLELTDASCQAATGRTPDAWYAYLDGIDGLKLGRRDSIHAMYGEAEKALGKGTNDTSWWLTTVYVNYEKRHDIRKKDGLYEGYSICCTKNIAAPPAKTYAAYIANFSEIFGDNPKQDVTEGGKISCQGGCEGTFTRIRPDKDLRFTWSHPGCTAPMVVDVQFQDAKGKTMMNVMTSRIQTREEADGLRRAWGEALNRLKPLAEA
ncbi:MAG: SRPBCC domain-containing protein [Chthonomonas sp.]|nr:SRPBCC domain-containing protein [Chthonomonas sp.]